MPRSSESGFVPHWFTMAMLFACALGSSPTSVVSFCYVAIPEGPTDERPAYPRSFAVDDTGRTCFAWAAEPIPCVEGRLPRDCQTLE